MKRIRCPKCTEHILFDEKQYEQESVLVFTCPSCNRQFRLRLSKSYSPTSEKKDSFLATLTILENDFQEKQIIPIFEGENKIGKYLRGNSGNARFITVDPSIDALHCILTAYRTHEDSFEFHLKDGPSNTGTYINGQILMQRDNAPLEDGSIINIGAATIIFHIK